MDMQRRDVLKYSAIFGLMASAGLITPAQAQEWNKAAFEAKSVDDVAKILGGATPTKSDAITLRAPDIAENGAVVPVGVETNLKATELAILVEKNPSALAAMFIIPAGAEAFASTRVKMGQTSNVFALAKVDGKWFMTSKEVKVTLGGCGG
mgnify:CR=1 FL=1